MIFEIAIAVFLGNLLLLIVTSCLPFAVQFVESVIDRFQNPTERKRQAARSKAKLAETYEKFNKLERATTTETPGE